MRKWQGLAAVGAAAALVLAGCASGGEETGGGEKQSAEGEVVTLKVGASPSPHGNILEFVKDNLAEEEGLNLEIVEFTDYIMPNEALESGELDANFFQTVPYLDDQIEERGYEFVPGEGIHLEPLGLYSAKHEALADIPEGATIGIISDPTNQERALNLLADEGFVEIPEDGDVTVNTVEPLRGVTFVEVEGPSLVRNLEDVDVAVINGNFALEGGLSPADDALVLEDPEGNPAVNVLVWPENTEHLEAIEKLETLLRSDAVREYIEENWEDGSVIPAF